MGDERGYAYPGQWYDEIENAPRPHECVECSDAAPELYPDDGGWLCINCAISRAVDQAFADSAKEPSDA